MSIKLLSVLFMLLGLNVLEVSTKGDYSELFDAAQANGNQLTTIVNSIQASAAQFDVISRIAREVADEVSTINAQTTIDKTSNLEETISRVNSNFGSAQSIVQQMNSKLGSVREISASVNGNAGTIKETTDAINGKADFIRITTTDNENIFKSNLNDQSKVRTNFAAVGSLSTDEINTLNTIQAEIDNIFVLADLIVQKVDALLR